MPHIPTPPPQHFRLPSNCIYTIDTYKEPSQVALAENHNEYRSPPLSLTITRWNDITCASLYDFLRNSCSLSETTSSTHTHIPTFVPRVGVFTREDKIPVTCRCITTRLTFTIKTNVMRAQETSSSQSEYHPSNI